MNEKHLLLPPALVFWRCFLQGSPQEVITLHLTWLASSFSLLPTPKTLTGVFRLIKFPTLRFSFLHSIQPMNLKFSCLMALMTNQLIDIESLSVSRCCVCSDVWHAARCLSELQSLPGSSQGGPGPAMSLSAPVLDASAPLWTGQLAAACALFFLPYAQSGSVSRVVWRSPWCRWGRCLVGHDAPGEISVGG